MNSVVPVTFNDTQVRIIHRDGEPWFVLADVCSVLGHTNSRKAAERLDDDEKGVTKVYTLGGGQDVTVINESGLYVLLIRSNKPQAKPFRKWVTGEVLPSIRKTGTYSVQPAVPALTERRVRELAMEETRGWRETVADMDGATSENSCRIAKLEADVSYLRAALSRIAFRQDAISFRARR